MQSLQLYFQKGNFICFFGFKVCFFLWLLLKDLLKLVCVHFTILTVFLIPVFSLRKCRGIITPLLILSVNENKLSFSMFVQATFIFHTAMLCKLSFLFLSSIFFIEVTCYEKISKNVWILVAAILVQWLLFSILFIFITNQLNAWAFK